MRSENLHRNQQPSTTGDERRDGEASHSGQASSTRKSQTRPAYSPSSCTWEELLLQRQIRGRQLHKCTDTGPGKRHPLLLGPVAGLITGIWISAAHQFANIPIRTMHDSTYQSAGARIQSKEDLGLPRKKCGLSPAGNKAFHALKAT